MAGMPGWPWRKRAKGGTLVLMAAEGSMRYVLASEAGERGATLADWGTVSRGHQSQDAFMQKVRDALPDAQRVIAVLDTADYQILHLEAPGVPPEEMRAAVRWRATEFMEGSPHDYTIDVLNSPLEGAGKVIAVVAHNNVLRARMLQAEQLGRPLTVIDVVETAQRNLLHAALQAEPGAPDVAAALVVGGGRALAVVAVRGQLSFFRRFEFNVDVLAVPAEHGQSALISQGAEADMVARTLTQLHRTLDLWDDSYPQLPLATLRVHAGTKTEAIVERLAPETGVDTRGLVLDGVFKTVPGKRASSPWLDTAYLPLLGALLRAPVIA